MRNDFDPLGSRRDAMTFITDMAQFKSAQETEKMRKALEEQNRLLREGGREESGAKEKELETLFQKYKCPCYDRKRSRTLTMYDSPPRCGCCFGKKTMKFFDALRAMGIDQYSTTSGEPRGDDADRLSYWREQGFVFVWSTETYRIGAKVSESTYVQCPRCNGTGQSSYYCEACEDTGIPLSKQIQYERERRSIENRYKYRNS